MLCQGKDRGEIEDVSAEEHQDAEQKDLLSLLLEDHPKVQKHIRNAAEDQSGHNETGDVGSRTAADTEEHEAYRSQSFQCDRHPIVLRFLLPQKQSCQTQAARNKKIHGIASIMLL